MKSLSVNRKNYAKIALFFLLSLLVVGSIFTSASRVYAEGEGEQTQTADSVPSQSLEDLSKKAGDTIESIQKPIVAIATAVGGLSMIICIVLILFTHDERKIAGYIKICITIAIALLVIYLINGNVILGLIQSIAKNLGGAWD